MQQLQKSYTLPNCTLVLDGMTDPSSSSNSPGAMTLLTNAVCRFLGQEKQLSGGSDFFNSLIQAVNRYAQQQLSGLKTNYAEAGLVQITKTPEGLHEFSVQPEESAGMNGQHLALTTVQLFDLVEAIDQFLADRSTLPQTELGLQPLSKRDIPSQESSSQRIAAPAIGAAGLAAAAAAFFLVGAPNIQRPEVDPTGETLESVESDDSAAGGDGPGTSSDPDSAAADSGENDSETSSGETSEDLIDPDEIAEVEVIPPAITDEAELESISETVFDEIDVAWNESGFLDFKTDATYQITASANGQITGYRGANALAQNIAEDLPLPDLLYIPPTEEAVSEEPLARLRVIFKPNGRLVVEPWGDMPFEEAATDSGEGGLSEESLEELSNNALVADLYNKINNEWTSVSFDEDLEFRVDANIDGEIVRFEGLNDAARESQDETPLPDLKTSQTGGDTSPFKVVFTSGDQLEITPLEGE